MVKYYYNNYYCTVPVVNDLEYITSVDHNFYDCTGTLYLSTSYRHNNIIYVLCCCTLLCTYSAAV